MEDLPTLLRIVKLADYVTVERLAYSVTGRLADFLTVNVEDSTITGKVEDSPTSLLILWEDSPT